MLNRVLDNEFYVFIVILLLKEALNKNNNVTLQPPLIFLESIIQSEK